MVFLKVIVSIAIGFLLLVLLNNAFAKIFPAETMSPYGIDQDDYYQKCQGLSPYTGSDGSNTAPDQAKVGIYDKCIQEGQQKANDQIALSNLYAWIKGIVVLLVLVVIAVLLFKKYPFYSSALIGCGLLFLLSYPTFSRYGGIDFLGGYSGDLSESVKNQVALFKLFASLVGFLALSAADLMFFEKEKKEIGNNL